MTSGSPDGNFSSLVIDKGVLEMKVPIKLEMD